MSSNGKNSLPAINISQQLFYKNLPPCENILGDKNFKPASCCTSDLELGQWYKKTPTNLWDTASNYQGGPGFSQCNDIAFARQCMTSQYFNYISKNNTLEDTSINKI